MAFLTGFLWFHGEDHDARHDKKTRRQHFADEKILRHHLARSPTVAKVMCHHHGDLKEMHASSLEASNRCRPKRPKRLVLKLSLVPKK